MKKVIISLSTLALILPLVATGMADDNKPAPSLTGTTEHDFVGHLEIFDDKGRPLVWEGTISGDINGVIQWWMGPMSTNGHVSSYVYRVEIWNSDKTALLLAGDQVGSTTAAPGEDAVWRGKGVVTEASAEFEGWIGRQVYESGRATWAIPGVLPDHGVSTFLIPLVVDLNGDEKVDNTDVSIMAGYWNTGDPVCDIGPTPLGDGIVDGQDLLVLAEYMAGQAADIDADIAAIEEVLSQYCVAMETGDLELWLSLHADDVVKMAPDAPATYGQEELRASTKPLFDNFTIEMVYNLEEIQVDGDLGFARGTFTATMTPKAGGEPLYLDAKTLGIYKRQASGSWKIARNCYNSNVPPAQ